MFVSLKDCIAFSFYFFQIRCILGVVLKPFVEKQFVVHIFKIIFAFVFLKKYLIVEARRFVFKCIKVAVALHFVSYWQVVVFSRVWSVLQYQVRFSALLIV